ncbi:phospholipase [Pseudarthrobacter sp. J75]|uniref:alpha/beta hydrolase n=1 Tax=unclassified Pseudarthrobacter TaxID=2647000 RepID=UPI002E80E520|nr:MULTISPECIES: phospholipase [unclassified Pseudarthrobacter]MEE2521743.1 phospholipase [Pseudarthrobacter sp. J47]MEE2527820.1 phospholipase [Pseudarthrobacter sp. J75]MEE2569388.1 phospholipase [Pseudarthrobacter sp. J64]
MTNAPVFPAPVVVWSQPEEDRAGKPLLVFLHGYGANEHDLLSLAEMLPDDFAVASVRAPIAMGAGFTWFPLTGSLDYSLEAVKNAAGHVQDWLDTVKGNHSSVTLLGFSMGMAMATTLLRFRPADYAAVVGLSGFVVDAGDDPDFRDGELDGTVPFFWGRDQQDPVITQDKIEYTMGWVRGHVKLTKVLYTGMWHGINQQEIGHVSEFLTHEVLKP